MPGPVSDSFDAEFGTGANAQDVRDAIQSEIDQLTIVLGKKRRNIVELVRDNPGKPHTLIFSERSLRVIRFALHRALESI